jgi:hypothetical protein
MMRKLWAKRVLLVLAAGSTLVLGFGGCLENTFQRILVGVAI